MDYGAIATLIASGIALITSIATLIANLCNQNHRDILKKRIFPTVSILNNAMDDVDSRMNTCGGDTYYRIFFDKTEKNELFTYNFFYFVIRNTSDYKITNCKVEIIFDKENVCPTYIGTLSKSNDSIIPVRVHNNFKDLICKISYTTESGEQIEFTVNTKIDFSDREEYYRIKRKTGYSKKYNFAKNLTISYNLQEFIDGEDFTFNIKK